MTASVCKDANKIAEKRMKYEKPQMFFHRLEGNPYQTANMLKIYQLLFHTLSFRFTSGT
jgi:hypothetical protein